MRLYDVTGWLLVAIMIELVAEILGVLWYGCAVCGLGMIVGGYGGVVAWRVMKSSGVVFTVFSLVFVLCIGWGSCLGLSERSGCVDWFGHIGLQVGACVWCASVYVAV